MKKETNGNHAAWGDFNDLPKVGLAMPFVPADGQTDVDRATIRRWGETIGRADLSEKLIAKGLTAVESFDQFMVILLPRFSVEAADRFSGLEESDSIPSTESGNVMVSTLKDRVLEGVKKAVGLAPSAVQYESGYTHAADLATLKREPEIVAEVKAASAAFVQTEKSHKEGTVTDVALKLAHRRYYVASIEHSGLTKVRERLYYHGADPQLRREKERLQRQITHVANLMQTARVELARLEESVVIVEDDIRRFKACPDQPAEDAVAAKKRLALRHELIEEARERHAQLANEYIALREKMDEMKRAFFVELLS